MKLAASLLGLAIALVGPSAVALTQPNGTTIPTLPGCSGGQPTGLAAVFSCICKQPNVCNLGAACPGGQNQCDPGTNGECESTMWHEPNDNSCIPTNLSGLDPYAEAAIVPETFHPTCPQTFTVRSRGTALFKDVFGWYNVTGAAPKPDDLHAMLDCQAKAGDSVVLDLAKEPAYKGGSVGFFLATPEALSAPGTCEGGDCCATIDRVKAGKGQAYFSERKYNPDAAPDAYIHTIIYQSHLFDHTFYFTWEDIYGGNASNDFTDFVASVSGIECGGGGEACDTGGKGVCAGGLTKCSQGKLACHPVFEATPEACNGLDDDCNGKVDDGATCEKAGYVCNQGTCVPPCSNGEFVCPPSKTCDGKVELCVDPACVGKECGEGEVCRGGACGAPCDGVVCPHGQRCVGDACVDLCAIVACGASEVCLEGQCFSACNQCGGLACAAPLACDVATGRCADLSCAPACPAGQFCSASQCKDACDGAVCPKGQSCVAGNCAFGGGAGGSGAGGFGAGGSGSGNSGHGSLGGDGGADGSLGGAVGDDESGCGCRAAGARGALPGALALALAALGLGARRRRERRDREVTGRRAGDAGRATWGGRESDRSGRAGADPPRVSAPRPRGRSGRGSSRDPRRSSASTGWRARRGARRGPRPRAARSPR